MAAHYTSKHGIVSRPNYDLYMSFADMRHFVEMIPADKKAGVSADFDTISATVQGMRIGARIKTRRPYSLIELEDCDAPFRFLASLHFDETSQPCKTDFYIDLETEMNVMMKMAVGKKLSQALDQAVDALVAVSEGRMPEGVDPSMFGPGFKL